MDLNILALKRLKYFKSIFTITFIVSFLFITSCSFPPPETKEAGLLESLHLILNKEDKPENILEAFLFFRENYHVNDLITVLNRGDNIVLSAKTGTPGKNTLVYTLEGNRIRVYQDVFVTSNRKNDWFFSLDSKTWYSTSNDRKNNILNIHYQYPIETNFNLNTRRLDINYKWSANKRECAIPVDIKQKETFILEEGTVFMSSDKSENTLDLKNCFLKIPSGTELLYQISFSGDLFKSINNNTTNIEILKDLYIYTSNDHKRKMGISLNKKDWNKNILTFKYNSSSRFTSINRELIFYNRNIEIKYKID